MRDDTTRPNGPNRETIDQTERTRRANDRPEPREADGGIDGTVDPGEKRV
jgi:hypothetical protein